MALTKKQEDFVSEIIKGATKLDAYRAAYNAAGMSDNACNREAWVLMENPKVAQRIKELQDKGQKQTLVTVELVTQMYLNSYKKAVEAKQHGSAVAAVTGLCKVHGLIVDRVKAENTVPTNVTQINIAASVSAVDAIVTEIVGRTQGDDVPAAGANGSLLSSNGRARPN